MGTSQNLISSSLAISIPSRTRLFVSAARYLLAKVLTIGVTIFVGILITILLVSHPSGADGSTDTSPFEARLLAQIDDFIKVSIYRGAIRRDAYGTPDQEQVDAITQELRQEAGLDLPLGLVTCSGQRRLWPLIGAG